MPSGRSDHNPLPVVVRTGSSDLWLPRIPYALRRLGLQAFSDSLQSCRPSSFRCSTRSDVSSSRVPRCILELIALRHQLAVVNRSRRHVSASRRRTVSSGHGSRGLARLTIDRPHRQTGDGHRAGNARHICQSVAVGPGVRYKHTSCLRRKRFSAANCARDGTMSRSRRNRSARSASAVRSASGDRIVSSGTSSVAE